ncbi:MAG: LacI family transcriptional regulator [Porphyromonadaceae bacterium CG2_30_38_12]|nr:MAG: LacI family transcriptional regulator [Porphyromonadaceae bacterium CG2_30_38_12]
MVGKAPITIKDIGRALNISPSTVSRALKNHPDISQSTKDSVNAYAKEFHYKPNTLALSLRMSKNNTIGVIVPEIVHYFFSSILSGIEQIANSEGFNVVLCQSDENYEKEVSNTKALIATRVSGVLASLSKHTNNYDHYRDVIDSDIPLVFFDRICIDISTDRVVVDDYAGAFAAVEYLIQTGCKRIAFYSSPLQLEISKNRKNGYLDALIKYGLQVDESLIKVCDTREEAIVITPEILDTPNRPDGFFAINDHCAAGILYACKLAKLRVPEDVSIMGFSDGELARACDPMLSTVEQHGYEMGRHAAKLLIDKINGVTHGQYTNKIVKTNLIIRGTTR